LSASLPRIGGSILSRNHFGGTSPAVTSGSVDSSIPFGRGTVWIWRFDGFAFAVDDVNHHPSAFIVLDFHNY